MIRFTPLVLAASVALAGCVKYAEVEAPPQAVSFSTKTAKANVADTTRTTIRADRPGTSGRQNDRVEIMGAVCDIRGTGYRARITTPAKVDLPTYRGKTDPVAVTCRQNGETASQTIEARNMTATANAGPVGGGLAGAIIMAAAVGAMKAARNPANDRFAYPAQVVVDFGKDAAK